MPGLLERSPVAKKKQDEEKWLSGRIRPVRCILTQEEHQKVRQAAALSDMSASKFVIIEAVKAAERLLAEKSGQMSAEEEKGNKGKKK